MNKYRLAFTAVALFAQCVLGAAVAQAASFDCTRAGSANEKLICGDAELSAMDDRLGRAFRQARSRAEDKRVFRQQSDVQWQWREHNCRDRACLVQWYGRRQGELEALAKGSMSMAANLPAAATKPILAATLPPVAPATRAQPETQQPSPVAVAETAAPTSAPAPISVPAAMASHPPATPSTLKLSLSAAQIAGVAPHGTMPWPHYLRMERGDYIYEDPRHDNALVTVRYYGLEHGQHILEASRGQQVLRYTCSDDCTYIGSLALPGDEKTDMIFLRNDSRSLPSLIVNDARNGLLATSGAQ